MFRRSFELNSNIIFGSIFSDACKNFWLYQQNSLKKTLFRFKLVIRMKAKDEKKNRLNAWKNWIHFHWEKSVCSPREKKRRLFIQAMVFGCDRISHNIFHRNLFQVEIAFKIPASSWMKAKIIAWMEILLIICAVLTMEKNFLSVEKVYQKPK